MRTIRPMLLGVAASVLLNGAAVAAGGDTAVAPASTADPDRIICRKILETGSLVKKNKQCFTKAEWDRIYAAQREGNQKLVDELASGFNCQATGQC